MREVGEPFIGDDPGEDDPMSPCVWWWRSRRARRYDHAVSTVRPILLALPLLLAACGGKVIVDASTGTGGTTSSGGCSGESFSCVQFCGSDFYPSVSECVGGAWICPNGTVDPATCPPSTCGDLPPLPCDVCVGGAWACNPGPACLAGCPSVACAACPEVPVAPPPGCTCTCDGNNQLTCAKSACCTQDVDCGDESLVPCVNGVCKQPVVGSCWSNVECGPVGSCQGVFVCPCGALCGIPDQPGMCEGSKP